MAERIRYFNLWQERKLRRIRAYQEPEVLQSKPFILHKPQSQDNEFHEEAYSGYPGGEVSGMISIPNSEKDSSEERIANLKKTGKDIFKVTGPINTTYYIGTKSMFPHLQKKDISNNKD